MGERDAKCSSRNCKVTKNIPISKIAVDCSSEAIGEKEMKPNLSAFYEGFIYTFFFWQRRHGSFRDDVALGIINIVKILGASGVKVDPERNVPMAHHPAFDICLKMIE